jgi:Flp pilus assembly protein TadD
MSIHVETFEDQKKLFETAAVLLRSGKLDDAITLYDYLVIQNPAVPQYWTGGGIAKMRRGLLEEAFVHFQVAEAADESDPVPILLRGLCLMRMGKRLGAMAALTRARSMAAGRPRDAWMEGSIRAMMEKCSPGGGGRDRSAQRGTSCT